MMYVAIGQVLAWIAAILVAAACLTVTLGWLYVCTKIVKYAWGN